MMFAINFVLNKTHTVGLILMAYALISQALRIVTVSIHVNFFPHACINNMFNLLFVYLLW